MVGDARAHRPGAGHDDSSRDAGDPSPRSTCPMSALRIERDGPVLRVHAREAGAPERVRRVADRRARRGVRRRRRRAGCRPRRRGPELLRRGRRRLAARSDRPLLRGERRGCACASTGCSTPSTRARRRSWPASTAIALGGGSGVDACVDIAVAGEDAVFGFSEVRLGIVPAVISPFVLPKIGPRSSASLLPDR